jgi:hypothetical protein
VIRTSLIDVGSHVGFVPFASLLDVSPLILKLLKGLVFGDRVVFGIDFRRDDIALFILQTLIHLNAINIQP